MAVTIYASGTETVGTTEWSLTTDTSGPDVDTTAGGYQVVLDLSNLANGDIFEFRVYEKAISGGTQRCGFKQTFAHAQGTDDALWFSPSLMLYYGWDFTLKKVAGTDRSIDWSIRKAG